ncbi:4'-phosphopantetheinyl transferase [Anopheles sinensis]|uniref:4'-phosphopantetheinyl transferase n=1 Tax=Anopheles sinensis TaxID=74873 RepID=A0A084W6Y5_ANOSI|nr:4'-phosphopantetheinyl transferase [Anopheles sinensis]
MTGWVVVAGRKLRCVCPVALTERYPVSGRKDNSRGPIRAGGRVEGVGSGRGGFGPQGYGYGRKVLPWTGSGPARFRSAYGTELLLLLSSCLNKLSRKAMLFFHDLHPSLVWVPSSSSSSCSFSPLVRPVRLPVVRGCGERLLMEMGYPSRAPVGNGENAVGCPLFPKSVCASMCLCVFVCVLALSKGCRVWDGGDDAESEVSVCVAQAKGEENEIGSTDAAGAGGENRCGARGSTYTVYRRLRCE